MRKFALSLVVLSLVAVPVFAGKYNRFITVGQKAPDFSGIPAVANGEDASVSLADLKEDVVVVVFLANHCPVVQRYEDRIIDFTNDYKNKSLKVGLRRLCYGTRQAARHQKVHEGPQVQLHLRL